MGMRATPVLYTLGPALVAAAALYLYVVDAFRVDRLFAWLIAINLVAFPIWAIDKLSARRQRFRVPENTLHALSVAGAAPAALVAMRLLRHKTLHRSFVWVHGGLLVVWGLAVFFWLSRP